MFISKRLEMIGKSTYILARLIATASDSNINQTACSGGHLSMWKNRCMHATVCLLRAGQPKRPKIKGIPKWTLAGRIRSNGRKMVK